MQRPMLAAKLEDSSIKTLRFPMLLSPKIDGIRALCVDGALLSRTMKRIPNYSVQHNFGHLSLHGIDGELVCGNPWDKNLMQQTSSAVMSFGGSPTVDYYVFDFWDSSDNYIARLEILEESLKKCTDGAISRIKLVKQHFVRSYDEVLELEQEYLKQGYEGVMIRSPFAYYKEGRSTLLEQGLVKVKRFQDAEAIVIGWEYLERNLNDAQLDERGYTKHSGSREGKVRDDLVGSLIVRDAKTDVVFSIGSGFTLQEREQMYEDRNTLAGRIVKYKSFNVGVKEKPRFPIFLGFRDKLDWEAL